MLILVRHGRTVANAGGLLLGRLDPELDGVGTEQAAAVAEAFAGQTVKRVVTSPLLRTRQTADAIGAVLGIAPAVDERWIELDYGDLDGVALSDVPAETWRAWRSDPAFTPPGGESLIELGRRVRAGIADLADEAVDDDIIVVTHVSPVKAAVAWALAAGDELAWRLFVHPASVTRLAIGRGGPQLVGFNDTGHLRHLP